MRLMMSRVAGAIVTVAANHPQRNPGTLSCGCSWPAKLMAGSAMKSAMKEGEPAAGNSFKANICLL
jgi:hypothetical protein